MVRVTSLKARLSGFDPSAAWILLAGWLVVLLYAFPGYLNWDSGDQIFQSRNHRIEDWHPPVMSTYWHVIEHLVRGPFGMLVLQTALFTWGVYQILCLRFGPRISALAAVSLCLFPPVLTPMAAVWKDAQMAGFFIAGLALALRPERWRIGLGVALLVLGTAVRDNGATALPPLCLLIVGAWHLRRRLATLSLAIVLFGGIVGAGAVANKWATKVHVYPWYKTVAIHDLAGSLCLEAPMTDEQVRAVLSDIPLLVTQDLHANLCKQYNPRAWFPLTFGDNNIFGQLPKKADRLARRDAWWRVVRDHTGAFLRHRWQVMREVLGLTDSQPWEPVCQSIAANQDHRRRINHDASLSYVQKRAGAWFRDRWSTTLCYRPWAYVLVSLILLAYAAKRRDRLVAALLGSGLLYEASYFIGAAAPDFRYSHWMITCCCLAALLIFGERFRAGLRTPPPPGEEAVRPPA
jgi:hypothetical protein